MISSKDIWGSCC